MMLIRVSMSFAAMLFAVTAQASVVTLCAEDTQSPPAGATGKNLDDALKTGGLITFACGGPATIRIKLSHSIRLDTRIEGGGTITFDGEHRPFGMFLGENAAATFTVRQLKVVNAGGSPSTTPPPGSVGSVGKVHGGFVAGRFRLVQLQAVSVEHSLFPVWLNAGALRVLASTFSNNDGSVLIGASMEVLDHSRFTNNRGSPIWSEGGTVTIDRSDFLSNSGPVTALAGSLKIYGTNFAANTAIGNGGALRVGSNATIEESEFRNNEATEGGAIFIGGNTSSVSLRALKFYDNIGHQSGGAISFEKSQVKLDLIMTHIIFQDNRANFGGAFTLERDFHNNLFFNGGAVAFIRNLATTSGGAIYAPNASVQLSRGVFIENRAGKAGGAVAALEQGDRKTTLANSLLVRNTAPNGAAFWGNSATFVNATIADNNGTAIWAQPLPFGPLAGTPSPIRFVNSIISGTFTGACGPTPSAAPYVNGGNNLQFPGVSCGAGIASVNPFLGAYYVPFFWSPALNAGNQAVCDATPINHKDVYNSHRPQGGSACAIGAVEGDIQHLIRRWLRREGS